MIKYLHCHDFDKNYTVSQKVIRYIKIYYLTLRHDIIYSLYITCYVASYERLTIESM